MEKIIDIYSKSDDEIAKKLSNFYPFRFVIDGIECGGMEGFLQSLKYFSRKKQTEICKLSGKQAKEAGEKKRLWKRLGFVAWRGRFYRRKGRAFTELVGRAYREMYRQNGELRRLLSDSVGYKLTHTMGKHDKSETILTEEEFIGFLDMLRNGDTV